MKTIQISWTFLFCLFFTISSHAQWGKIGVTMGYDNDLIKNLDASYITGASNIDVTGINMGSFNKQTLYSMACENPHFRVFGSYNLPKYKNASVDLALVGIFNRWDDVSYYSEDYYTSFGSISHELAVESVMNKRFTAWDFLYLDLGIGANGGVGFGGYSYIHSSENNVSNNVEGRTVSEIVFANDINEFSTEVSSSNGTSLYGDNKTSLHARTFAKCGAGIIFFNRIELGAAVRYGIGLRKHVAGSFSRTEFMSVELNSAYRF